MPETYTQEQIDEAWKSFVNQPIDGILYDLDLLPECLDIPCQNLELIAKSVRALKSALSTAERERDALKARCAELGKAGDGMREGVDEDQYPNETEAWDSAMTALMAQVAELEARLQGAGWISIKDNKPEYPGEYLMYDDDIGNQSICTVKWTGKLWTTTNPAAFAVVVVTHWMQLPEPPAIVGKKEG